AGPILFNLTAQNGVLSGTFNASSTELGNLRAGLWYVNVHSNAFTNGELRGQLAAMPLPVTYGEGCRSSTGRMPLATTHDLASLGSPLEFALYGAECCNLALLAIGLDRSTNLAVNLPSMGFQAPDCHALTDVVLSNLGATDPFGCARMTLSVPFDQVLRGASMHLQWLLVDPAANAIGLVVSNASTFTIL
ncbi:MAG: CHRD domain-containing protein, partial [Planctomycetota bacterium]